MMKKILILAGCLGLNGLAFGGTSGSLAGNFGELWQYQDAVVKMENGLWSENAPDRQFGNGRTNVVIVDIKGPGIITMIHFAFPLASGTLDRSAILRMYWDGETNPSV